MTDEAIFSLQFYPSIFQIGDHWLILREILRERIE